MVETQVKDVHHDFEAQPPEQQVKRLYGLRPDENAPTQDVRYEKMYLGVVAKRLDSTIDVGFSVHDGTYNMDYAWHSIPVKHSAAEELSDYVIARLRKYEAEQRYKFLGAGLTDGTLEICPCLAARMWAELDIVTLVFRPDYTQPTYALQYDADVDEQADSMARKCVIRFGPNNQPRLSIGLRNEVDVDVGGEAMLATIGQYEKSVGPRTWQAIQHYISGLKRDQIRIAFFNSTPQGGGVALMRHALVRFARLAGVHMQWFVPKPKPEVFRITKTNHNILQGVASPEECLSDDQAETIRAWTEVNAQRFWLSKRGPLRAVKDGGAHIVIVDDPQMPYICKLAKEADPDRPVIFRSHIQIRADLVDNEPDSPTAKVFDWLWSYAKYADLFVAHPVKAFVPAKVSKEKVLYLPATTDWLDGLNKELSVQDSIFYMSEYNNHCIESKQPQLAFPARDYIVQIARFDPAKGIDTVVRAYGELRRN
ncbi:hypothetical protein AAFC00_004976 [Neodothiora populina]|uniref:Trehalose synthase N-terminal domain-containing protein n=1 Tax=Neodothiora populina TaxID=2781224 RepID=A0ABR3P3U2_9PEZI